MGICFSRKSLKTRPTKRLTNNNNNPSSSHRWTRIRSTRKPQLDENSLVSAAILLQQLEQQRKCSSSSSSVSSKVGFERSSSVRNPKRAGVLPRSSSSRARSLADPLLQPHQLVHQVILWLQITFFSVTLDFLNRHIKLYPENKKKRYHDILDNSVVDSIRLIGVELELEDLETSHFVLVHGGGFGAWCWYKTITLLEECGFKVTAIDLTGSGINSFDTNSITSLSQYVKPLTSLLEKLVDDEKVILVGHDFGGTCISYAMELFPNRVSKAIFLAATMLASGESTFDMFSQTAEPNDIMRQAQTFVYANGNTQPPAAINIDKAFLKDLLFNQSPNKDVALASVSMRPLPFAPVLEKLSLSDEKYGLVRRFYIETLEDNAIHIALQESMINKSPPECVFRIKGSDHSPFFSRPQALHKLLVEISKLPRR